MTPSLVRIVFGMLGLEVKPARRAAEGAETPGSATALVLVRDQPIIWGRVGGCFLRTQSRAECLALVRAAGYKLGLPSREQGQLEQHIAGARMLLEFQSDEEARWHDALVDHGRTGYNDRCLASVQAEVVAAFMCDSVNRYPRPAICLYSGNGTTIRSN
jgi:hypothetical protein